MMNSQVADIVKRALEEVGHTLDQPIVFNAEGDVSLYGSGGRLDSMALVSLIVAIEQYVETELNVSLILANEKAMSQKNSPFRSFKSLVSYTSDLLVEGEQA